AAVLGAIAEHRLEAVIPPHLRPLEVWAPGHLERDARERVPGRSTVLRDARLQIRLHGASGNERPVRYRPPSRCARPPGRFRSMGGFSRRPPGPHAPYASLR